MVRACGFVPVGSSSRGTAYQRLNVTSPVYSSVKRLCSLFNATVWSKCARLTEEVMVFSMYQADMVNLDELEYAMRGAFTRSCPDATDKSSAPDLGLDLDRVLPLQYQLLQILEI